MERAKHPCREEDEKRRHTVHKNTSLVNGLRGKLHVHAHRTLSVRIRRITVIFLRCSLPALPGRIRTDKVSRNSAALIAARRNEEAKARMVDAQLILCKHVRAAGAISQTVLRVIDIYVGSFTGWQLLGMGCGS